MISTNPPEWLANGASNNYHDFVALDRLARVMNCSENSIDEDDGVCAPSGNVVVVASGVKGNKEGETKPENEFLARIPLCLHCRKPASQLCQGCLGAYFCSPPAMCFVEGWSHQCLCSSWQVYTDRRNDLVTFPLSDGIFAGTLVGRDFQTSESPYEAFLIDGLGVSKHRSSWWNTEMGGWSGGSSESAMLIDASVRKTYAEGFEPILAFPEERYVSAEDIHEAELSIRNEVGLLRVSSWQEYYRLRRIPLDSPLVLLLTFPATLYHAIVEYGTIPCTVAYTIMKRPLRIHIVGVEKELNFLDIFKEVSFLLPEDFVLELTFVVHHDMQPSSERNHASHGAAMVDNLTPSMRIVIAHGSYGDSLNPNFDCGSGRPDMIMAFNAGLFAYESWRSVVSYLDHHKDVVGVFTDYNEFSGVQCASLGGAKSRNSLTVNPFRQPRAMPVYCMNLPQFSNGFLYVFNEQSIE